MDVFNLCSIPVFCVDLKGNEKISRKEYEILTSLELTKREQEFSNSTLLSKSSEILSNENLKNIRYTKNKYVNHYLKNILSIKNNFSMTSSWLTMNSKGSAHERHSHGNVILSCVLYFSEDLKDGPMSNFYISQNGIKDVFKSFQFTYDLNSFNEYNSTNFTITTRNNLLIIFPAWMLHGSEPSLGDSKRYCIGSNYFLNDHVGGGYHSLSVEAKIKDSQI